MIRIARLIVRPTRFSGPTTTAAVAAYYVSVVNYTPTFTTRFLSGAWHASPQASAYLSRFMGVPLSLSYIELLLTIINSFLQ